MSALRSFTAERERERGSENRLQFGGWCARRVLRKFYSVGGERFALLGNCSRGFASFWISSRCRKKKKIFGQEKLFFSFANRWSWLGFVSEPTRLKLSVRYESRLVTTITSIFKQIGLLRPKLIYTSRKSASHETLISLFSIATTRKSATHLFNKNFLKL